MSSRASGSAASAIESGVEVHVRKSSVAAVAVESVAQADSFSDRGGSSFIAVLIGQPRGRWTPELNCQQSACKDVRETLSNAAGEFPLSADCPGIVVGVVVFGQWRFVTGAASHAQTFALMKASEACHARRSGHRFVEHEVLAAAQMSAGSGCEQLVAGSAWLREHTGSSRLNQDAATAMAASQFVVTKGDCLRHSFSLRGIIDRWSANFNLASDKLVAWPVDYRLAIAIARGTWWGDVSVKHRRQLAGERSMAPVRPADELLRQFLEHRVGDLTPPQGSESAHCVWMEQKGSVRSFHPEHIIASARACAAVANKAKLREVLLASARWWAPGQWQSIVHGQRKIEDAPAANSQRRHIIRMDIASMLARRQWYKLHGPTYRYLAFDASPQHGQEYFVSVERVVRRVDLQHAAPDQWPAVESRVLPLNTLGCGRMGLADKVQTHVHQVWLEYGPSVRNVRAANLDVRQCLSDMGTELGIGDASDCVSACVGQSTAGQLSEDSFLYPLALVVPGPQHILDTSLTRGLDTLPWWPEWQRQAKIVCQWLRPANRRSLFRQMLRDAGGPPEQLASRLKALTKGCESFAAWRWKTLSTVTADLLRFEDPVRAVVSTVAVDKLASREANLVAAFLDSCRDPQFWERNAMLFKMTGPIKQFSSWLQGCQCHEEDRLAGSKVECQWSGCRAPDLATRLEEALSQMQDVRAEFYSSPESVAAVNVILSNLRLKMSWVWQEPYLVWRAHDPSVAQQLIDQHDAMVRQGQTPHRVTSYLCGAASGQLRADMVSHAGGAGLSERLRVELRAYSLCKLDDTWAESTHRDISCLLKRTANCRPVYVAGKLRLQQTLASIDGMAPDARCAFAKCLQHFKAIGQSKSSRAEALLPSRKPLKVILDQVYRCDALALRNWGSELGCVLKCLDDGQQQPKRSIVVRLQIEYLSCAVVDGQLLSLPAVDESVLCRVDNAKPSERNDMLLASPGEQTYFVVVDKTAGRKKRLRTSSCTVAQMSLPVTLQRVTQCSSSGLVYHDGCPEMVDLLPRAAWNVWRFGLRQWSTMASQTPGCLALGDHAQVVPAADWKDTAVPTLRLLEELASRGWSRGFSPLEHTVDTPRLFSFADPLAAKAYLRCLLGLEELFARDVDFAALPSKEQIGYYQCVLLSEKPSLVARGQPSAHYRSALKALTSGEENAGQLLAIADADADADAEAAPPIAPSSAGVEVCVRRSDNCQSSAKRRMSSSDSAVAKPKPKLARAALQSDWQAIVCADAPAPAPVASLSGAPASSSDPCGSVSASIVQVEVVASSASGSGQASIAPLPAPQPEVPIAVGRTLLEGVAVVHEAHGIVDTPGSYRRLMVTCPHHRGSKPCRKKRNFGVRSAATALGDAEPYAFLGAWLRAHADFESASEHSRFAPSAATVRAYASEVGIVAPAAPGVGPAD